MIINKKLRNSALLIASTAIISSCQTARQLDQGLYSLTDKFTQQDLITGARTLSAAERKNQIKRGNSVVEKMVKKYQDEGKKINAELNERQYERIVSIFNKVHSVSHLRNESWDIYLIPEDSFNAFVTGGTTIVVHMGLLEKLSFDDEIASVIGHEIAHVAANHVFEGQAEQLASLIGGSKVAKTSVYKAGYSVNNENEADKVGILYTALAGFDPMAAPRVWKKMHRLKGDRGQILQTHPVSSERFESTTEIAKKVKEHYIPGKVNPNFEYLLSNNNLYAKRSFNQKKAGSGGGILAVAETAMTYYQNKQKAKQQAGQQVERISILKEIQENMQIVSGKMLSNGKFAMLIQYNGFRPVDKLAIKAVSQDYGSLYRLNSIVPPDGSFTALFDKEILETKSGEKAQIKLIVDEGYYIR